ncbi:LPP20 family lipoprotein [Geomonas azotofigens]|uniref:LPP20 family lipoprotein n=1 Tax=Geomonas azotofigens TaxID=2843196 RepID=UPI001C11D0A5|nr:LPP20 family lipoprotein [Geomonas azotofigens]MBU5614487.1 LPP20 family lipoprotein [Geomonas azotofigens]
MLKMKIIFTLLALALLAACSSTQTNVAKGVANPVGEGAPQWVLDPGSVAGLNAVGSAAKSPGGIQFQRNEAMAGGRDELARILSVKVKNSFKNFSEQTGVGDSQTFDKVTTSVSQQLAKQTLNGSKQKDLWLGQDGTMYILVSLDPKAVADITKQLAISSLNNERALFQKEEAKKAFNELEADIDKEFNQ